VRRYILSQVPGRRLRHRENISDLTANGRHQSVGRTRG
jgi:hypothetical protein